MPATARTEHYHMIWNYDPSFSKQNMTHHDCFLASTQWHIFYCSLHLSIIDQIVFPDIAVFFSLMGNMCMKIYIYASKTHTHSNHDHWAVALNLSLSFASCVCWFGRHHDDLFALKSTSSSFKSFYQKHTACTQNPTRAPVRYWNNQPESSKASSPFNKVVLFIPVYIPFCNRNLEKSDTFRKSWCNIFTKMSQFNHSKSA